MADDQTNDSLAIIPHVGTPEEALATAYGLTGVPDLKEGYNALQRHEYLQAIGHGAAGLAAFAPMAKLPMAAAAGIFGGARALAAPVMDFAMQYAPKTLANAIAMGRTTGSKEIFDETGWFVGPDAKWRFTIPDDQATLLPAGFGDPNNTRLPDVLYHPELFKNYPHLENTKIVSTDQITGARDYNAVSVQDQNIIGLNPKLSEQDKLSTLLHEVQHNIQDYEGHATGGVSSQFLPEGFSYDVKDALSEWDRLEKQMQSVGSFPVIIRKGIESIHAGGDPGALFETAWNKMPENLRERIINTAGQLANLSSINKNAFAKYQRLAGEVESRTVQEQLAQKDWSRPPWEYEGYTPFGQQLVIFGQQGGKAALIPVGHDPFGIK